MQLFKSWMGKSKDNEWTDTWDDTWSFEEEPTTASELADDCECDCDCTNCEDNISPKELAALALIQTGMVSDLEDPRIDGFWTLFCKSMDDCGYIMPEEIDEYCW